MARRLTSICRTAIVRVNLQNLLLCIQREAVKHHPRLGDCYYAAVPKVVHER